MKKKNKISQNKNKKELRGIVYLSVDAELDDVEHKENKQFRYIGEYAKAHNIVIQKVMRRSILGQAEVNKHFRYMVSLIAQGKADGILVANMMSVATDLPDAYAKVGRVVETDGIMITVDEGKLYLPIKGWKL